MIWLVLGVLLWSGAHLFKRIAPDARARLGDKAKGPISLALLVSVVLMVVGYRMADGTVYWGRGPILTGINNVLMLLAIYLFAAAGMKTRITRLTRNPQMNGFKAWATAHLLVNGDTPSFVLFGGLIMWAVVQMHLARRAEPAWTKPAPAPLKKEIMAIVGTLVVYVGIVVVHSYLGYVPYG